MKKRLFALLAAVIVVLSSGLVVSASDDYSELIGYMDAQDYQSAIRYICNLMMEDAHMDAEAMDEIVGTWKSRKGEDVVIFKEDGTCLINEKACEWQMMGEPNEYGSFTVRIYPDIYDGKMGEYFFNGQLGSDTLQFGGYTSGMDVTIALGEYYQEK